MNIQEASRTGLALTSSDYSSIMRAAIETSLDFNFIQYPVSMERVLKTLHMRTVRYQQLPMDLQRKVDNSDALTIPLPDKTSAEGFAIFVKDYSWIPGSRIRFSLAHELAHLVLPEYQNHPMDERACEFFAANFLAPTCLILRERYSEVEQVMEAFHVSRSCAAHSLHRAQQHAGKPLLDCEIELMREATVLRRV